MIILDLVISFLFLIHYYLLSLLDLSHQGFSSLLRIKSVDLDGKYVPQNRGISKYGWIASDIWNIKLYQLHIKSIG